MKGRRGEVEEEKEGTFLGSSVAIVIAMSCSWFQNGSNGVPPITTFLPAIVSTSTRMHGEFLHLLFLHAHRETEAQVTTTGMPSQRNTSDMFRFKRILPVAEEQSRTRGGQAAALRINLNVDS
jgi:hypothetical protein